MTESEKIIEALLSAEACFEQGKQHYLRAIKTLEKESGIGSKNKRLDFEGVTRLLNNRRKTILKSTKPKKQ